MATYEEVFAALTTAFAKLSAAGEIDVTDDDAGGIDVTADAWTFHAEGWPGPGLAWLAHDDEPDTYDEESIRATLPEQVLTAFVEADRMLNGALLLALNASKDPLSGGLASMIG